MSEWEIIRQYTQRPPVDVVGAIRALGILYREEPMRQDQSGYFQKSGNYYTIGVNANESPQRKRFTAAHELGHYVLHRDLLQNGQHLDRLFSGPFEATSGPNRISPYHEVQANRFAADILMPAALVSQRFQRLMDVGAVAAEFGVSPSALKIRLKNLNLIA
ncbi:ImmA/IrrE family metallo-endopeptidase [Shinella sp.]|uniref:ImmA/IrrE family metallo-endopeptidase n=1 Tax=Shinella sp. TaxID=1870904 RepID=UPI0029A42671|nr:ImmA/IrrE family metallo-endopeptidase [Shinella sp.]MDX3973257.1 ImmA/IrrE family metallo-endopeptidase [Shinella sp.]